MMKRFILIIAICFCFITFCNSQNIYTYAGNGSIGYTGDSALASQASFNGLAGLAIDGSGNLFVGDYYNKCIRKINSSGIITTIASQLSYLNGIGIDKMGKLYASVNGNYVYKIDSLGIGHIFAGNGSFCGCLGDGGSATSAQLSQPGQVISDSIKNIYIADAMNSRIRKIDSNGVITSFAGINCSHSPAINTCLGDYGYSGDGGRADTAQLNGAGGMVFDASGNMFITQAGRIRKIDKNGIITLFAGNAQCIYSSGDGGPAILAGMDPNSIAIDKQGNIYFSDRWNSTIRKIDLLGIVTTIAGSGTKGYSGDGGLATQANLDSPTSIVIDNYGNIYFNDSGNNRIRIVCTNNCLANVNDNKININSRIFPNPNNGSFKLKIENQIENGKIILINSLGQKVYEQEISNKENNIITNGLASGLYNYIILENKVQVGRGKLSIE